MVSMQFRWLLMTLQRARLDAVSSPKRARNAVSLPAKTSFVPGALTELVLLVQCHPKDIQRRLLGNQKIDLFKTIIILIQSSGLKPN